jgi:hypothetical protein
MGQTSESSIYDSEGNKIICHSSFDHYDRRRDPYYGITIGGDKSKDDRPLRPENQQYDYILENNNPTGCDLTRTLTDREGKLIGKDGHRENDPSIDRFLESHFPFL